jgi:hypothetical protein
MAVFIVTYKSQPGKPSPEVAEGHKNVIEVPTKGRKLRENGEKGKGK